MRVFLGEFQHLPKHTHDISGYIWIFELLYNIAEDKEVKLEDGRVRWMEVVLPFEVEVPSLRILAESELKESEWAQACFASMDDEELPLPMNSDVVKQYFA